MHCSQAVPRILRGELQLHDWFLSLTPTQLDELPGDAACLMCRGVVGNVTVLRTGEGLVLADTGTAAMAEPLRAELRRWSAAPIHTIVLTHGHWDHLAGLPVLDAEAQSLGRPLPRVVAHANLPRRLARYRLTGGYNTRINARQFPGGNLRWPPPTREPDLTYAERLDLTIGGRRLELHHGLGETDDHTWLWVPDCKLLITGDFFIWSGPNCGNPQKVQRYCQPWADALREMLALGAQTLIPGHGPAIQGAQAIAQVLGDTIAYLEHLHSQTVACMNQGLRLNQVLHQVRVPEELARKPYLRPTYDHPEFVVRNIWRLYGGWYDGNPAHLLPAEEGALARELASLAGGAERLAARARELAQAGDLRLAGHLAETAALAEPANPSVHQVRAEVFRQRAQQETSVMSRGIFTDAALESEALAGKG